MSINSLFDCECCGEPIDGLFPLTTSKGAQLERPDLDQEFIWCVECLDRADCLGPYGGACCKGYATDEWWNNEHDEYDYDDYEE